MQQHLSFVFDICSMGIGRKRHFQYIKLSCLFLLSLLHSCMLLTLDEIIQLINKENSTWKAGRSRATIPKSGGVTLGAISRANVYRVPIVSNIPDNFDARIKWPECHSTRHIRDQKNCGSCWAMSAASVMSDRICIKTKGQKQFEFSAEDLLTCCDFCRESNGCKGGKPFLAFKYWADVGVVSGGDYGSRRGCKPYSYGSYELGVHPYCIQKCTNRDYQTSYADDKHYGGRRYFIEGNKIAQVQSEILTKGPVVGVMEIYEDFRVYKKGIYTHKYGKQVENHGIKILGWGVENHVPYWLAANSWGPKWGEEGFFRIMRGINDSGIETAMIAATSACGSLITNILLYLSISFLYFFI